MAAIKFNLGTGVAAYLAGKYPDRIGGLFLVAPYDEMSSVAKSHLPLFPVRWMLRDTYPASEWLKAYHRPLAVLLAGKDTIIPAELGRKLFDEYRGPKKLWIEPEASHDDIHKPRPEFFKDVVEFWNLSRNHAMVTVKRAVGEYARAVGEF